MQSYVQGILNNLWRIGWVGQMVANALAAYLGNSPPTKGKLVHVGEGGKSVVDMWVNGVVERMRTSGSAIDSALPVFGGRMAVGALGGAGSLATAVAGGGQVINLGGVHIDRLDASNPADVDALGARLANNIRMRVRPGY